MNWLLAALSGLLLVLVFPKFGIAFLAPFALTPLIFAAAREPRPLRRFGLGYVTGLIFWGGVNYWIQVVLDVYGGTGHFMSWLMLALFCLAKALHMGAFALLAGWAMRVSWAAIAVPAVWVVIEWTHGPLGFAWLDLGNAGIDMSVPLRLAPITGVYGLSFLFALMATAIAIALLRRPRGQLLPMLLVLVPLDLPFLPDVHRGAASALLVQPNIPDDEVWNPATFESTVQRMNLLSVNLATGSSNPADLVVWPEVPAPFYENTPEVAAAARRIGQDGHTYLLAGIVARAPGGQPLNSAALWSPDGQEVSRYDKVNLVPFGEFVPWPLGYLTSKVSTEAGDFKPGTQVVVSPENGHKIGTFICYESVFPNFIRRFAQQGAEALFNISNDSWFGHTAARYQHLQIVRMRAVENRRWILRATNDGITVAIDPAGRPSRESESFQALSGKFGFNYLQDTTIYTRWGDWFVFLCVLTGAAGIIIGILYPSSTIPAS
ncbi:MAG TPA: apolipoprotein N-acyltransferase [Bryobacteraceae bacterium]